MHEYVCFLQHVSGGSLRGRKSRAGVIDGVFDAVIFNLFYEGTLN